jgi:preprotein translocase subunit SecD
MPPIVRARELFVSLLLLFGCGSQARGPREPSDLPRLELRASDVTAVRVLHVGDSQDALSLDVSLTPDAGRRLEAFTAAHVGERVAILVDGETVMTPEVRDAIAGGHLEIGGSSAGELRDIRRRLSTDAGPPAGD